MRVDLGDNTKYIVEGIGSMEFQIDSGGVMEVNEVLYELGLDKNLLSISAIEERGLKVNFKGGEVDVGLKGTNPSKKQVIGRRENNLYMSRGQPVKALIHENDNHSDTFHRSMEHNKYRALPIL